MEPLDLKDHQDRSECLVHRVMRESSVSQGMRVPQDVRDQRDHQARRETWVHLQPMATPAHKDHLDRME